MPRVALLFLAASLLLPFIMVVHATAVREKNKVTACPAMDGFDAIPDKAWFGAGDGTEHQFNSFASAEAYCRSTTVCTAFDNYGNAYDAKKTLSDSTGACTYLKQICPPSDGYRTLPNTNWQASSSSTEVQLSDGDLAKEQCDNDPECTAYNDQGYYLIGNYEETFEYEGFCTYVKDSCPPKSGYKAYPNTNYEFAGGIAGEVEGWLESGYEAEERCNSDPRCTAFNLWGYYYIGSIKSLQPYANLCTYVKTECVPVPGFTAYNDVAEGTVRPAGRLCSTCVFQDARIACTENSTCTGFDDTGYFWSKAIIPNMDYPSVCTYVRAPGF